MNTIHIQNLEVFAQVGVPDEERARAQRLLITAVIEPLMPFDELNDDLTHTVDYDAASRRLAEVAAECPRKLIETLAAEMAKTLTTEFPARRAEIEVRKFILPNTEYVAVRCSSELSPKPS